MGAIIFIMLMVAGVSVYDYFDSRDWQSATSTSRNNVIFEHRNKKYGAYHLRRDYNDSFGIIIGGVILALAIFFIVSINIRTTPVKAIVPTMDTTVLNIAAPPVEEIKTIKTPYKIVGGGGGGSAGAASQNPVDRNTRDERARASDTPSPKDEKPGQSDRTNSNKQTNNTATTLVKGDNPFGGGGAKKGNGSGIFGKDQGTGSGVGEGNGENGVGGGSGGGARKKLTNLNPEDIQSNETCTIVFYVFINAEGNVVRADLDKSKTTTTNASLIEKLKDLVKKQIKYDKRPGTEQQKQVLKLNVQAT